MRCILIGILVGLMASQQAALAQTACSAGQACSGAHFSYKPGDTSLRVFGDVVVHVENDRVMSLSESSDADGPTVIVNWGVCIVSIQKLTKDFPAVGDNPGFRTKVARDDAMTNKDGFVREFPAITGTLVEEVRAEDRIGIYDLSFYKTTDENWYVRRSIATGQDYLLVKICLGDDLPMAKAAQSSQRVEVPLGPAP
jgi:hypothetical protein